jgi:hypothetical protein
VWVRRWAFLNHGGTAAQRRAKEFVKGETANVKELGFLLEASGLTVH